MKMMNRLILFSVVLPMLVPALAWAQNDWWGASTEPPYNQNGFYVSFGGAAGIDMALEDELEDLTDIDIDLDDGLGFKMKAGYRFLEWAAVELEYEYLTGFDAKGSRVTYAEFEYMTLMANGKLYLPFDAVQPFALFGVGAMYADLDDKTALGFDTNDTDVAIRMGGGIDVYLTDHIAVVVDASYVLPTGDLKDLDYISIGWGVQYRF